MSICRYKNTLMSVQHKIALRVTEAYRTIPPAAVLIKDGLTRHRGERVNLGELRKEKNEGQREKDK